MIEYATVSETGEKDKNEDCVKIFVNQALSTYAFVLADGLGGHGNGDVASKFVVDCVGACIENTKSVGGKFIDYCFDTAQSLLMEEKERTGLSSIKTTMVLMLYSGGVIRWGHVGDSRLYHFRDGKLISRTVDHSVPQMLALSGQIKERDIRHHPDRSVMLHAMGSEWTAPEYEISQRGLKSIKGDSFLLCSDGFWEWIEEKAVIRILKDGGSAYEMLKNMTLEVKTNGTGKGMDNYSAILVNIK